MLNVSGSMSFSSCRATKVGGALTADSVYVEGCELQLQFSQLENAGDVEERSIVFQLKHIELHIDGICTGPI